MSVCILNSCSQSFTGRYQSYRLVNQRCYPEGQCFEKQIDQN